MDYIDIVFDGPRQAWTDRDFLVSVGHLSADTETTNTAPQPHCL